jgi:acetyl-CoA carboxylase biotin carboxyl carrier protein
MTDLDATCQLVARLVESVPGPLRQIRVRSAGTLIELEWPTTPGPAAAPLPTAAPVVLAAPADEDAGLRYVTATTVGTFYRSPKPGAPPFITEGDQVRVGTQVAVLEAMKMMMPIETDIAGEVMKILPEDGTPVEYGERLIAIAPVTAG